MKKYILNILLFLTPFLFINTSLANNTEIDYVDTITYNCSYSKEYRGGGKARRTWYIFNCSSIYNNINQFNIDNEGANPSKQMVIQNQTPCSQSYNNCEGNLKVTVNKKVYKANAEKEDNTSGDYPYELPENLQPKDRPETTYYNPDQEVVNKDFQESITYNLEGDIKESAGERINKLETGTFQYKRQSCSMNNTNRCFITAPDGSIKSTSY